MYQWKTLQSPKLIFFLRKKRRKSWLGFTGIRQPNDCDLALDWVPSDRAWVTEMLPSFVRWLTPEDFKNMKLILKILKKEKDCD